MRIESVCVRGEASGQTRYDRELPGGSSTSARQQLVARWVERVSWRRANQRPDRAGATASDIDSSRRRSGESQSLSGIRRACGSGCLLVAEPFGARLRFLGQSLCRSITRLGVDGGVWKSWKGRGWTARGRASRKALVLKSLNCLRVSRMPAARSLRRVASVPLVVAPNRSAAALVHSGSVEKCCRGRQLIRAEAASLL